LTRQFFRYAGKYALPVPRGLYVEFQVIYNNHTFQLVNYADRQPTGNDAGFVSPSENKQETHEYFLMQKPTDKIDFEDVSTINVTVELAGGLCNSTLPASTIWFTRQPECGINFKLVKNLTSFSNVIALPAHRFDFTFGEMKSNLPTFNLAVRDYLIRANNNTGEFNLINITDSSINKRTRFEYHPLPTLTLGFSGMDTTKCTTDTRSFMLIQSETETNATITLSEDYPLGLSKKIDSCTNIQGQINITNNLGEDNEKVELLNVCRLTCPMDIVTDPKVVVSYQPVCAENVAENDTVKLQCPPNSIIDSIDFASFGARATGECIESFTVGDCKAAKTLAVVTRACKGNSNCSITAQATKFGVSSCNGSTPQFLTVQAICRTETTYYENARVELEMQVGYPNRLSPFFKTFVTRMQVLGYIDDILIV
jgi:hypothetical protein